MKKGAIIAVIIIIGLFIYGVLPSLVNTNPASMQKGKTYYIYGTVESVVTINNKTEMLVNDNGNNIYVSYNGPGQAVNSTVLIYGTYQGPILTGFGTHFGYMIHAINIYKWYYEINIKS
ncbi:hypothetical protein [Picrophilus oshimae]|uniref:Uncharacterized protein n=1 Tax=Picrophilus torridus (strain ATCC 700027 / DSM 9790 / JCM 10055 / NBRC 100828 / KAW 2/3) TaxID=1122961 RepID=A0A8G2FXI2_PICTO|nr:hypothetical protein [Picrophilus oshimae]SMD31326.1 hypothetical protein SAMN02745355_1254 [Picrophilus oshimae DSM 9789]